MIPVAQIKNCKSNNGGYRDIQKGQKGKKIILAVPKFKKKTLSRQLKETISRSESLLGGKKSVLKKKSVDATDGKLKSRKINKEENRSLIEDSEDDNDITHESGKNEIKQKRKIKNLEVQVPLCPFDSLIFLGDLNYRMDLPRLEVRACHGVVFE